MFRSLFKRISELGVDESLPKSLARRIRLTNRFSVLIFFVTVPYYWLFESIGATFYSRWVIYIAGAYLIFPLLNAFKHYNLSRMWMILHFNAAVFTYASSFGEAAGIHLCFFTTIFIPLLVFNLEDRWKVATGLAIPIAGYLILGVTGFSVLPQFPAAPEYEREVYWAIVVSNFVMITGGALFFWISELRAERALESERDFISAILDTTDALFLVTDEKGCFVRFNHAAERASGYTQEEVRGKDWRFLIPPEEIHRMKEVSDRFRAGETSQAVESRWVRKDGQLREFTWTTSPLLRPNGKTWALTAGIDVTAKREADKRIAEQQIRLGAASKMSALGEMASGIAHEVNNPLTAIQLRAGQIREMGETETLVAARVATVGAELEFMVERISKIMRSLRSFARESQSDPFVKTSIQSIVEETLTFCRERFRHHTIELKVDPIDPALSLECRTVEISQVLLNMLSNALDATDGNGGDSRWVRISTAERGDEIEISVTDSGKGIAPELAAKIFVPLFTTKDPGKGTGLGLSISRSLVESHFGSLELDRSSANTRFVVRLPKKQKPEAQGPRLSQNTTKN